MAIFNSYVKLPEGRSIFFYIPINTYVVYIYTKNMNKSSYPSIADHKGGYNTCMYIYIYMYISINKTASGYIHVYI